MKVKEKRLETIKMILSSQELGSQEDVLRELKRVGINVTQATLSRDFKQLKVAKTADITGKYVYVLPNVPIYKRPNKQLSVAEMMQNPGFKSIEFSGNIGVIRTKPGYASAIAYNIDSDKVPEILGTIAGDDTIIIILKENVDHHAVIEGLNESVEI
ncbi:MAG: arginine repressor [Prevotella sp.]|nr:arginine repressor [Prevotella sp.]MDD3386984.1 arginine repressor [Prevotella sp.]MDD4533629.1 arginine repressor [Prevotella sp.]MDT3387813.1 arginine repressor [Bacteroidota bacterium]